MTNPTHPLKLDGQRWDREKVIDHICGELATSSKGIGKILKEGYEGQELPAYSKIMLWVSEDDLLWDKYARAKSEQADFMADEMLEIADDDQNDWQRARLRVDTRKWLASKLKPKKYGERLQHAGHDDGPLRAPVSLHIDMDADPKAAAAAYKAFLKATED